MNGDQVARTLGVGIMLCGCGAFILFLHAIAPFLFYALTLLLVGGVLVLAALVRHAIRDQRVRGEALAEQLARRAPINEEEEW